MEMRYLGIDYGEKRVGLALSDEQGDFSYPLSVIQNSENIAKEISDICKKEKVKIIVVGESKDYDQNENPIMNDIKIFIEKLKKETDVPIHLHPEFLTSVEAEHLQGHNEMHDASAAAIMLNSFLDTQKNKKK